MIDDEILAGIEAVLMISDSAVSATELATALGLDEDTVTDALAALKADYDGDETTRQRGFEIRLVAGGFRIFSRGDYHDIVKDFLTSGQSSKLSQAALETLAVIAYRQPVARSAVSAIRGVNVDGVVRTLVQRGLLDTAGTDPVTGATLYVTTAEFLERLGLDSLEDLPRLSPHLPGVEDLADDDAPAL